MRINLEYLSQIFNVFLESDKAHINLSDLEKNGIALEGKEGCFDESIVFHMQIAIDNKLIGTRTGLATNIKEIGMQLSLNGSGTIVGIPIRLTQKGHDFSSVLNNKEVLSKLKSEFKDAPFQILFDGGQKLLQHVMKKKIDALMS